MKKLRPSCQFLKSSEQGFSLIEAMMGFTITAAVLAAMAPVLMIAVGTRLQNYRAEQAMQLAQSQINRVQTLMTQGVPQSYETGVIPPAATQGTRVNQVAAPTTVVTDPNALDSPTKALLVDYNNDNRPEFMIQMFRDQGVRFTAGTAVDQLAVFQMGVRVYAGAARDNIGSLQTTAASFNLTRNFGEQRTKPLAVLYTEVSRSDLQLSLQRYQQYLR